MNGLVGQVTVFTLRLIDVLKYRLRQSEVESATAAVRVIRRCKTMCICSIRALSLWMRSSGATRVSLMMFWQSVWRRREFLTNKATTV